MLPTGPLTLFFVSQIHNLNLSLRLSQTTSLSSIRFCAAHYDATSPLQRVSGSINSSFYFCLPVLHELGWPWKMCAARWLMSEKRWKDSSDTLWKKSSQSADWADRHRRNLSTYDSTASINISVKKLLQICFFFIGGRQQGTTKWWSKWCRNCGTAWCHMHNGVCVILPRTIGGRQKFCALILPIVVGCNMS